jgi:hypothetical protein
MPKCWPSPCRLLKRRARLSAALLVAAAYSATHPAASFRRVANAIAAWVRFARARKRTPFWKTYRRYRACSGCPLFYKPLRTCGSPLDGDLTDLGCWCNMEAKAPMPESTCWMGDNLGDGMGRW